MLELPASFGKYFLTDKIATGGMAEIYLAKLIGPGGFEKQLVIKQIHPELGGKPAFVDLFVTEAKTLVSLSHGNIVPIYELGLVEERYFIAMEYIDGPTLERLQRALAARGQVMEPALAAHVAAEILKGLDYAHRKGEGVIHRDLSPRNVMLSREGEVKLVDFGIAVPLGHERERDGGVPVGSFPYMSPEQVRGERLTGQSDVFSAGVLLWEMLVGRPLFARASAEDTLAAVTDAPIVLPSVQRPGVPAALDAICVRALARDPSARYASAAACLADVHRWLYSLAEPVAPVMLSRLVAMCCPPAVQRGAIDAAAALAATDPAATSDAGPGTVPLPRRSAGDGATPAGTAPFAPVQGGTRPRGKRRAATEQSFATHVEIERVLAGTVPSDGRGGSAAAGQAVDPVHVDGDVSTAGEPVVRGAGVRRDTGAGVARGAGRVWLAVGIAVLALAAGGGALVLRGRTSGLSVPAEVHAQPDEAARSVPRGQSAGSPASAAAAPASGEPSTPAIAAPGVSSAPVAAKVLPASASGAAAAVEGSGAGVSSVPVSSGQRMRPSAGADRGPRARPVVPAERPATPSPVAATGTLKVGANPWGEVYLDGVKLGRTPHAWQVPAGAHVVEVVFPVADPPPRRRFRVDIAAGETESLGVVDFSAPAQD
jgi:tRNA A-37 threonylcarbamoyl transferase component Bud32